MKHHYEDIRSRIPEPPRWFDEHGVPRYCDFDPDQIANIYADQAALVLIECQNCQHPFEVAFSWSRLHAAMDGTLGSGDLATRAWEGDLSYQDPPNIGCCPSGPTMTSVTRRVLQFWRRDKFDWIRAPEWEKEPGA